MANAVNEKLVFDVGMWQGEDSTYYLKKGYKVVAFEANPELIELGKERFLNEIKTGKLVLVEGAIAKNASTQVRKYASTQVRKDRTISFYKNNDKSYLGTIVEKWDIRNKKLGTTSEIIRGTNG